MNLKKWKDRMVFLFFLLSFPSLASETPQKIPELVIYTYDSFLAKNGLGQAIFPLFEKSFHCRIRPLSWGDGGQISTRLDIDSRRKKAVAHLVLGMDQHQWEAVKPYVDSWGDWRPEGYHLVLKHTRVDLGFLPFDYSFLAMIADLNALEKLHGKLPLSLQDLLLPLWKKNILLQDPRTSTPGLAFLLYTQTVLGKSVWNFWAGFRNQWLTLTPGWDSAYRLFLKGEAPLVWSYVTSQAYHEENPSPERGGMKPRYQAVLFREGQPLQVEGAALIKGDFPPAEKELARKFLSFLISKEVQAQIPKTNWMLPVRENVPLPRSFERLPKPGRVISVRPSLQEIQQILGNWSQSLTAGSDYEQLPRQAHLQ